MASDFNKDAAKKYGILIDKYSSYGYNGVAKEACILIAFDKWVVTLNFEKDVALFLF